MSEHGSAVVDLDAYGWVARPSGRFVHPDLAPLPGGRRRVFTEAEALTLTAAHIDGSTSCPWCATSHE